jgi:hypothetical protein
MAFTPFVFTDAQLTDIRRYCGYPNLGDGNVVFPYPWIMKTYMALEYRLQHMSASEGAVIVTYLGNLATLETDIYGAAGLRTNLDTAQAAVWTRNPQEMRERKRLYSSARRELCHMLDVPPGPGLQGGGTIRLEV